MLKIIPASSSQSKCVLNHPLVPNKGQAKHQSFMFSTNKNLYWQQPITILIQHFMDEWTVAGALVNSRWEVNTPGIIWSLIVFVLAMCVGLTGAKDQSRGCFFFTIVKSVRKNEISKLNSADLHLFCWEALMKLSLDRAARPAWPLCRWTVRCSLWGLIHIS